MKGCELNWIFNGIWNNPATNLRDFFFCFWRMEYIQNVYNLYKNNLDCSEHRLYNNNELHKGIWIFFHDFKLNFKKMFNFLHNSLIVIKYRKNIANRSWRHNRCYTKINPKYYLPNLTCLVNEIKILLKFSLFSTERDVGRYCLAADFKYQQ